MRIELTEIFHGRETKKFPIFTIDHKDGYLATGSLNGEMKIYHNEKSQTYKNHKNTVLCVRFDPYSDLLASGSDDKTIIIYEKKHNSYKKIQSFETHTSDVSSIYWHRKFMISAGYDGFIFVYEKERFNVISKVKAFDICYGVIANEDNIICQSDKEIKVFDLQLNLQKTENKLFCGNIVEAFFARSSFSHGYRYLAVCLTHNNKANSVDILNDKFEQVYSLIGHVAPVEAVCFFPHMLVKNDKCYDLLAVGSQDRSISFWISDNLSPFLLLKNVFEQPILDMFWKDYVLYAASYDGTVKTFIFTEEEIGKGIDTNVNNQDNVSVPLTLDGLNQELFLVTDKSATFSLEKQYRSENPRTSIVDAPNEQNKQTGSIKTSLKHKMKIPGVKKIKPILITQEANEKQIETPKIDQSMHFSVNKKGDIVRNNRIFKRINLEIGEYCVLAENNEKGKLTVVRAGSTLYSHSYEKIQLFKANKDYLVVVFSDSIYDSLVVYQLETGLMHLPIMTFQSLPFIDLIKHKLLLALGDSTIKIIDLKTRKSKAEAKLPIKENLQSISLHAKYNIIACYDFATFIYQYKMKMWFKKKQIFDTILYNRTNMNFSDVNLMDETFDSLEYDFMIYEILDCKDEMIKIAKRMVKLSLTMKKFDEILYNKFLYIFRALKDCGENRKVVTMLESMNANFILQPYVFEMASFFKSQSQ